MPNIANAHAYGDITNKVMTAPLGTSAPTSPAPSAYPQGWSDLGWLADDGLTETPGIQETKRYAWQGGTLVAVLRSQAERSFGFQCLEENAVTLGLLRPNSTVTTSGATAEVQSVTISGTPTGGTFTLALQGFGVANNLAYNITTSALATALNSAFGMTGITVSGTAGSSYTVTFPANNGNLPQMVPGAALTGGTNASVSVSTTTPGVNGINSQPVKAFTGRNLRQFGIDLSDGTIHRRLYVATGEVTGNGDIVYKTDELTILQFTLNCYADSTGTFYTDLNDNPALAAGLFS